MRKMFLNPLFAPVVTAVFIAAFFGIYVPLGVEAIFNLSTGGLEYITAAAYSVPFAVLLFCLKDFKTREQKETVFLSVFLLIAAAFREAGIQHWMTSTDTTAFKLRFFTNPNNPLGEKIMAGTLLFVVGTVIVLLLVRYTPKIIKGFFKFNPMYWTICTLGGTGILGKISDRFPGNWRKENGDLPPDMMALFTLGEETAEAVLPLLFALALWQFHLLRKTSR